MEWPGSFHLVLWPLRALGLSWLLILHSDVQLLIAYVWRRCSRRCLLWEYKVEELGTSP